MQAYFFNLRVLSGTIKKNRLTFDLRNDFLIFCEPEYDVTTNEFFKI